MNGDGNDVRSQEEGNETSTPESCDHPVHGVDEMLSGPLGTERAGELWVRTQWEATGPGWTAGQGGLGAQRISVSLVSSHLALEQMDWRGAGWLAQVLFLGKV